MKRLILSLLCMILGTSVVVAQMEMDEESRTRLLAKSDSLFARGVDLYNAGKYQEALPIFSESDKIDKAVLDPASNRRDYAAMWLASCYYQLGDTVKAGETNEYYAYAPVDRRLTVKSDSLFSTGLMYLNNNEVGNALNCFMQCAEIEKAVVGEEHVSYLNTMSAIAYSCLSIAEYNSDLGNYAEAIRFGTEALNILEKVYGKEHLNYAIALNKLAQYNSSLGNYSESLRLATEELEIRKNVYGKEHPDYASSLSRLANYTSDSGNYSEALKLGTEALNIRKKALGTEHPDYAQSLNNLAYYNSLLGDYSEAISLCTEALNIREKVLGTEHPSYAESLSNLASYKASLGNYLVAILLCSEALNIYEKVYGKEHTDYVTVLSSLATYNYGIGNYTEALRLGTEALNIFKKVLGTEHPIYARLLSNLASYNAELGNYSEALRLGTEALNIRERLLGRGHPSYATSLNNLANYNSLLGDYSEAIRLTAEAYNIFEKVLGTEHPDYAQSLSNLASCFSSLGYYAEALRLGTEALNIRKKTLGTEHPDYAQSLNNLADYNSSLGNHYEAERLCTEALNIYEKVYGKEHPDYALLLHNLAAINYDLGYYPKAIELGTEALTLREKILGTEHPDYAQSLSNLARYSFCINDHKATAHYAALASVTRTNLIKRTFADLTTAQRIRFWEEYNIWFESGIHCYSFYMPSDSLTLNGYNGVLLSKGLLLNSEIEFSKLIQESGDSEALVMYEDLRMLRLQINKLIETPIAERFTSVDSLERIAQEKEAALVDLSKVYGDYTANLVITWEQVQEKLTDKDIAVEFVSFPLNADSTMYIAYTLRKGWEYPRMMRLFEEKQLKKIYSGEYYTTTDISELIWKPLEEVLQGVETVYFAPSGELYNIAIESVPDYATNGENIVSDSRTYYRLSSTRELALKKDKDVWKEAAVYGGLKYGMTAEGLTADSRSFNPIGEVSLAYMGELYNIADTLSVMRGGTLAEPLPGTQIEAEAIDKNLKASGVSSTLYTDSIGTEASFKNLNGKKTSIMHIGTHGFYWTEKEAKTYNYKFLMNDKTSGKYVEDKQLTRSGLLFAGANYVLSGSENQLPEGVDDGILTAKELTTIDLRGLDMVVLSACQTGLGEITGDGVFGLQRGFKKAGAQTIVMSLWKVNDKATELFMTKFFETIKLDKEGHPTNKHEAFLAAQRYLRDEYEIEQTRTINSNLTASQMRRLEREGKSVEAQTITEKVKPYADPKFWAAFIMLDGIN